MRLTIHLEQTLNNIITELGDSPDLRIRQVKLGEESVVEAAAVHLNGLAKTETVNQFVMGSLLSITDEMLKESNTAANNNLNDLILNRALEIGEAQLQEDWNEVLLGILSGKTLILIEGYDSGIMCETEGGEARSVTEPSTQLVVRGPKDSFVESLATNVSLIRRRIRSPKLRLEHVKIGAVTQTDVVFMYIKDTADEKLVEEVRKRLQQINVDAIMESGYIEELIQDKTFTPFPTINNSERPDVAATNLLEGRVVIVVDGTPLY